MLTPDSGFEFDAALCHMRGRMASEQSAPLGVIYQLVLRQAAPQQLLQGLIVRQVIITQATIGEAPRMCDYLDQSAGVEAVQQIPWCAYLQDRIGAKTADLPIEQCLVGMFYRPDVAPQITSQPYWHPLGTGKFCNHSAYWPAVVNMLMGVDVTRADPLLEAGAPLRLQFRLDGLPSGCVQMQPEP